MPDWKLLHQQMEERFFMKTKNNENCGEGNHGEPTSGRSETELRYAAVFDHSPDGILIIDSEGKIVDFNKAAHSDLGYSREEFSKLCISDIDPLESPEDIRASIQRVMSEIKAEFEVVHRTKSGQLRNVLVITQPITFSGRTLLHAIWRDITEQKSRDMKFRYLASILEHVPDAVCSIDTEGMIVSWNEGAELMLGYKAHEIIGRPIGTIIPEEKGHEEVELCIGELNRGGIFAGHVTVRIAKDCRRVPVEISGLALRDGQKITGYASIMRDISKRLSIEKALLESESKYRDLFENASDAVFVLDSELRYKDVNMRGLNLLGYTKKEILGKHPFDFMPGEQRPHSAAEFDKLKCEGSYEAFEGRMLTKDGRCIDIEVNSTAIFRDGCFAGSRDIVRDITERKRMERALEESRKFLEAIFEAAPT
jgi:two-component system, sensor histidine kinase and response regulator